MYKIAEKYLYEHEFLYYIHHTYFM